MEPQAECMLVILGATPEGKKELVGFQVGMRESAQSWRELLVDIKARGLAVPPEIAVGDGAMGFWKALDEVFPGTRHQRCCPLGDASIACRVTGLQDRQRAEQVPEIDAADGEGRPARDLPLVTLLRNALPGSGQAETRAKAKAAMDIFAEKYGIKYEKAVTCLTKDRDTLLAFYGSPTVLASNCPPDSLPPAADRRELPADHWDHLRTSNPIESIFATIRHRTVRTRGALSQKTAKLMVFKLVQAAAKTWRRLKGANRLPMVIEGVKFADGVAASDAANRAA